LLTIRLQCSHDNWACHQRYKNEAVQFSSFFNSRDTVLND